MKNASLHTARKKKERTMHLEMKCPDTLSSIVHFRLTSHSRDTRIYLIFAEPAFEPALPLIRFLRRSRRLVHSLLRSRLRRPSPCGSRSTSSRSTPAQVTDGLGSLGGVEIEPMIGLSTPIKTLLLQNLLLQLVVGAVHRAGVCGLAVGVRVARTIV